MGGRENRGRRVEKKRRTVRGLGRNGKIFQVI
jgi:hypothetical protein